MPRLMKAPVQTRSIMAPCDLFCCLPWSCSQSKDLSVMMRGRAWMTMMKDSVQKNLSHRSVEIIPHILCISRDTILLWISEKNIQACMPVLQLPKPCSLQHTGGKCRHTNTLGTRLYISVLGKVLFSCLLFLFLLLGIWLLFLGVGDTTSLYPSGSVTLCFHTPLLSFRVSCHKGVREAHTLCATSKKTAFKPLRHT